LAAARIDWARWTWPVGLALIAAPVGLLAGLRPELAVITALGFGFVLIVFANLSMGLVIFTFLTFFELIPGTEDLAFGFTKLAGLVLALGWLASIAVRPDANKDVLRAHPEIAAVLVLFLSWAGISFIWAEDPAHAVEATYRLTLNAALFLIVYTAVRTPKDVKQVMTAFVIGACAAMLWGLATGAGSAPYGEARLSGEAENANELASTLVAALSLALGLAFVARRAPVTRIAMLCAAGFAMFGIVLTVSRSGLVALGVAILAAIVFSGRWRPRVAVVGVLVGLVAFSYFAFLAPSAARERVTHFDGGTGREDIWRVAWRMVEDNPAKGVGAGNFENTSIHYLLVPGTLRRSDFIVDTRKTAHNVYLGTLAELGVVGLALLAALILILLITSFRAIKAFERNGNVQMEILARAQLVAIFGLLAALFFSSDEYKKQLWLLLAMAPALLAIARMESAGRESDQDA
jgi:O-antigen ligase